MSSAQTHHQKKLQTWPYYVQIPILGDPTPMPTDNPHDPTLTTHNTILTYHATTTTTTTNMAIIRLTAIKKWPMRFTIPKAKGPNNVGNSQTSFGP